MTDSRPAPGTGVSSTPHSSAPLASVIIPAHNEANVIGRCLDGVLEGPGHFEVVVISNGSTDGTVEVAREYCRGQSDSQVETVDAASKIAALRRGDQVATAFPRIYLDADIQISGRALADLATTLRLHEGPAVGAPRMVVDTSGCGWVIRAYHNVWTRLPYADDGVIGAGIYAVNSAGAEVKGEFPDVLNDDAYVRGVFPPHQRVTTQGFFMIAAPRTVSALVRRRARVHVGNEAVESMVSGSGRSTARSDLAGLLRRGHATPADLIAYVAVTVAAMVVARIRRIRGSDQQWSTDVTSREPQEPQP